MLYQMFADVHSNSSVQVTLAIVSPATITVY